MSLVDLIPVNNYSMHDYGQIIIRLALAIVLGGLIGFEREYNGRPAGLRTHILVSVGSALIMIISIAGFPGSGDKARLAAQVVSGIGFLGAGAILRTGEEVKGLTTAATLWIVSAIGLACGNGFYFGAIAATFLCLIVLIVLRNIDTVMEKTRPQFTFMVEEDEALSKKILALAPRYSLKVFNIESRIIKYNRQDYIQYKITFHRGSNKINIKALSEEIKSNIDLIELHIKG